VRGIEPRLCERPAELPLSRVPEIRITVLREVPPRLPGEFVLYWMIAFRRLRWNFALDRAVEWAQQLEKPLLILEPLRLDYPWASGRFHRFVLDGMAEKTRSVRFRGVHYYPYVETAPGAGKGLLASLARRSCVVVTDDFPCFFFPRMIQSAARRISVRLEAVDSNGILPLRAAQKTFTTAHSFRRFLQQNLPAHFEHFPARDSLGRLKLPAIAPLSVDITSRWPPSSAALLEGPVSLQKLPIDRTVPIVPIRGGEAPAQVALRRFLSRKLTQYGELRNQPEMDGTSELSPYLHFGHVSVHQIFRELMQREQWSERRVALRANGSRTGWWGVSVPAEEFLDQLVTWREVGFNSSSHCKNYAAYESLPAWARKTLASHARDQRSQVYSLEDFAEARTHDPLWNAAQRQLVQEGRIHNYLRMLWGKKILEWSRSPQDALAIMIELNNRYALDGRDPNSYSGIFWCLGRYDRPWGPERPVFGKVRYMSSENTARKVRVRDYIRKYGG